MPDKRRYLRTHRWINFDHCLNRTDSRHWSLLGEAVARCNQIAQSVLPPAHARELYKIYLIKGAQATTAIEGNTLSEEQIAACLEGRLDIPQSREYLKQEVDNVLEIFNQISEDVMRGNPPVLNFEWIAGANEQLLAGLEGHMEEGVVPGQIPTFSVGVLGYRGAPREDCAFLLDRLCEWLEGEDWMVLPDRPENQIASAILKAIFAHLYLAWIHAFGDGNGRTARLVEFMILLRAGIPSPCAHLLSDHYNLTRSEYYRQLDRSSRANSGDGDPLGFLLYSLEGFVDGLREQSRFIEKIQMKLAWEHFVYNEFQKEGYSSKAMLRRRTVALSLGRVTTPVRKQAIPDLSPGLARLYAEKTAKTLTRDINWLAEKNLLEKSAAGYRAKTERMRAFRPSRA